MERAWRGIGGEEVSVRAMLGERRWSEKRKRKKQKRGRDRNSVRGGRWGVTENLILQTFA